MSDAPIESIGLIMDGNRRWAKAQGLPTLEGHRRGYEKLKEVFEWAKEAGIEHTVVYGFSTENWNRSKDEVEYLMNLIRTVLSDEVAEIKKKNGRMRFVGQRERFAPDIQAAMQKAEEDTKNGEYTLWLALSYGGRAEIVAAANDLITKGEPVTEEQFSKALWSADMPDPDIIVRTSGEERLSGFMTWGSVYSELFFISSHWPAFSKEEFQKILDEYRTRDRRHGK